jgi:hypothetical protein
MFLEPVPYVRVAENATPVPESLISAGVHVVPHKSEDPPYVTVASLVDQQSEPVTGEMQAVNPVPEVAA